MFIRSSFCAVILYPYFLRCSPQKSESIIPLSCILQWIHFLTFHGCRAFPCTALFLSSDFLIKHTPVCCPMLRNLRGIFHTYRSIKLLPKPRVTSFVRTSKLSQRKPRTSLSTPKHLRDTGESPHPSYLGERRLPKEREYIFLTESSVYLYPMRAAISLHLSLCFTLISNILLWRKGRVSPYPSMSFFSCISAASPDIISSCLEASITPPLLFIILSCSLRSFIAAHISR